MKRRFDGNVLLVNLRETYHEKGDYSFKIVLNPKLFKHGHEARVWAFNPNNEDFKLNIERWGRKINCGFTIDDSIPNGVCVVKLKIFTDKGKEVEETFSFWVIK